MGAVAGFSPSRDDIAKRHFYREAGLDLLRVAAGMVWHVALLLNQALQSMDAILRALYRMAVSQRHLLQWTTAEAAQARASTVLATLLRTHWRVPVVAMVLLALLLTTALPAPMPALVLCLLWAGTPGWIWWVSRRRPAGDGTILPAQDRAALEQIAHATWGLFERCVVAGDNHLPPDNLQTVPQDMVAHRTSPTNIGLYLLSAACARRFGWIDTAALVQRLGATLATLARLERHRGHFLNWYDTQTCAPLAPAYVSTVDSGNLCGHLLAVAQACRELAGTAQEQEAAGALLQLAHQCEDLGWSADFSFLYHPRRHLFHIGYRVAEQQLDAGFYDLLASESRLTSLLAIARGDVPVRHWAALGRPAFALGAQAGLRSWSGSMFEYLMPTLVLDEPQGSVLRGACEVALREQVDFARRQAVPWGVSECAYAASDHTLAYQYTAQGVPRLALRRTLPDELVVAPYATALAAQIAPQRALRNFAVLQALGARTALGFMEALDFTPARRSGTDAFTPVATYMAHHQGMTIVALANVLFDGVAQRWGMGNPRIEAVASLLQERAPREISSAGGSRDGPPPRRVQRRRTGQLRDVATESAAPPPTHVLSNGRYSVTLRPQGAGSSSWGRVGIHRTRDDALRDGSGSFLYLRRGSGVAVSERRPLVSVTRHPAPDPRAQYRAEFHADRVGFEALWSDLRICTTVWVSPEDDIEFRQVEVRNTGDEELDIELLSAFEVTLAEPRSDESHPVFSNLFVRAHWQQAQQALVFVRTPRLATEQTMHMAHFLVDVQAQTTGVRVQADRQRWLGRNHTVAQPLALLETMPDAAAAAEVPLETGLDPVCVLAVSLRIASHASARLTFATAASDSHATLHAVIDKYRQPIHVQRASLMSATLTGIRLRELRTSSENFAAYQTLTTALVSTLHRDRPTMSVACDRRLLWRFGISGDRPLILVSAAAQQGLGMLRTLAHALRWWSWGGIACDLVVVNAEPASYLMALQQETLALRDRHAADTAARFGAQGTSATAMHVLRSDEISPEEMATLKNLARLRFNADGRPLAHHVQEWSQAHALAAETRLAQSRAVVPVSPAGTSAAPASLGRFSAETGDFRFEVHARVRPQRPWINVLANPGFGTQVSEAGGGYSWAVNSRMMQLTAWSNDPVADPPCEWLLLQDRRSRQTWSLSPGAHGDPQVAYRVAHGQGVTVIRHRRADLDVKTTWVVDAALSVKQVRVRLENRGPSTQHLRLLGMVEWLMGAMRADRATTQTAHERVGGSTVLYCTQREQSGGFGCATAFLALAGAGEDATQWTCDRREFFDAAGALVLPRQLAGSSGAGLDPCAGLSVRLVLGEGQSMECVFLLGYGASPADARALAAQALGVPAAARVDAVRAQWDALLGAATVRTPDPLFDVMVNRWLLYQAVSCRLWAKAGFYQAGGATGFRDQLQDAMALAWSAPHMLRAQIVLCASRQFAEGDVQHWWHAPLGAGVRTHFSDDLLWLPHATVHYLRATGDEAVLDVDVPFLSGAGITPGAEDAYYTPQVGPDHASVYEHGARAIDHSLRVGAHGLPLMGSGDWNDGMNRVGIEGRGESVWLGWFLCRLVADYAPVARARQDLARAERWEAAATGWKAALLGPSWDGHWYLRAFFDDGQPLGAAANPEARIDLIAQAWAVLSGVAPLDRQRAAMAAARELLMDASSGLVKLLDPPLALAVPSAGYIQSYPPGVRENGGQYAHAAVWALMAQAALATTDPQGGAEGDLVYRIFTWLSPAHRASDPVQGPAYRIEPYVMAGDVYSQPPYAGRGGWSWYTGAAAWLQRAAIESIFGLHLGHGELFFRPCLPSHWPQAELTLARDGRTMRFILTRSEVPAALAQIAPGTAGSLRPGEVLRWNDLPAYSCFLVLIGVETTQDVAAR
jgi:cyclic beta-1,2-glucan synthetase